MPTYVVTIVGESIHGKKIKSKCEIFKIDDENVESVPPADLYNFLLHPILDSGEDLVFTRDHLQTHLKENGNDLDGYFRYFSTMESEGVITCARCD